MRELPEGFRVEVGKVFHDGFLLGYAHFTKLRFKLGQKLSVRLIAHN